MRPISLMALTLALAGCSDSDTTLPVNDDTGTDAELCEEEITIGVGSGVGSYIFDDCAVEPVACVTRGTVDEGRVYELRFIPCGTEREVNSQQMQTINDCYPPGEPLPEVSCP